MDTFYLLNKLLSNLHFSILGYNEHSKEIDKFFENFCDSSFVSNKKNIQLVSYSYVQLKDIIEWKTDNFSDTLFFHALNEKYSLPILNFYYLIRKNLFVTTVANNEKITENSTDNTSNQASNDVANVLSRLFIKDVGFRLSYSTDDYWTFSYLEQSNIFSIRIPLSRLINPDYPEVQKEATGTGQTNYLGIFYKGLSDFLNLIIDQDKDDILIVKRVKGSKSTYKKTKDASPELNSIFDKVRTLFLPDENLLTLKQDFIKAIGYWHKSNPGFFVKKETDKHIENWVELFFQIVFVSLVFNSWIEYFPAVCGVSDSNKTRELRNLGGLIIGYKLDSTITQEDRSIYKIISSRLSATIAGQWMFEHNKDLRREINRNALKNAIDEFKKLDTDILHGKKQVDDDELTIFKEYFSKYEQTISDFFEKSFNSQLEKNNRYCSKYCLVQLDNSEIACSECKVSISNPLFSSHVGENKCCKNELVSEYFDIPFIKALFESFFTHKSSKNQATITKEFFEQTFSVILHYQNGDLFDVSNFIEKLKAGHNGSFIGKFLCDYYDLLDCHGIFTMAYAIDGEFKEFFNSRKSIDFVDKKDKKIKLNKNYKFPEGKISSASIKLTFINEL